VATATHGSEFVATCTAMEQIIDLRIELRYLGVPIKGSKTMFGYNESVVNSTSVSHARLHKRHTALSFHCVCEEGIAAGVAKFHHVRSAHNPVDVLSKQWSHKQAWPLLQLLLFWEGNTLDCVPKEEQESEPSLSCPSFKERGVVSVSFLEDSGMDS
jgi:hypothetical protein